MRRRISSVLLFAVPTLGLAIAGCNKEEADASATAGPPTAAAVAPDLNAIAHSLVVRSAGVKEGDMVLVSGSPRDLELIEDIVTEVEKAGANALPVLTTERMTRKSYDDVPDKFDSIPSKWPMLINEHVDAIIAVDPAETPDLLAQVPPSRVAARANAGNAAAMTANRRRVRTLDVGNDMYPTHARAARFGMSRDQLASFFWSALNADFSTLNANAKIVKDRIANAKEVHITDANGTDLRVGIAKKKWLVSDGVATPEAVAAGDFSKYLPAGELYSLVDPGTAEGTIVADRYAFQSKIIEKLTIKVSKGRIVSMTAPAGLEGLQKVYDAEPKSGKAELGVIDFGLNPGIRATEAPNIRTYIPEGMISLFFGNDSWAGGSNRTSVNIVPFLAKATVEADGKIIVENGVLKK